jgi:phage-related protein
LLVALEPFIVAFADAAGEYLAAALQTLGAVLQPIADLLGFLGPALGPVIAGIYAANKAVELAKVAWGLLNTVMKANVFVQIGVIIATLAILIIQNWDAIQAKLVEVWTFIEETAKTIWAHIQSAIIDPIVKVWNEIVRIWDLIKSTFKNAGDSINATVSGWVNGIGNWFANLGTSMTSHIRDSLNSVGGFFRDLPGKILSFIKGIPGMFVNLGRDIISGILRGLGNLGSAILNKLKTAVSNAWDSVLSFFGIHSPSTLAAEAGRNIVAGLVQGIDRSADTAVRSAAAMAAAVGNELTGASGTLAMSTDLAASGAGLPGTLPVSAAVSGLTTAASAAVRGGDGAKTVIVNVQSLSLNVAGNLDPTNPTAYRQTIVRIKDAVRNLDKEYA